MTKGKYAARAARRREDQDVQSEIGAYQHRVARLAAEAGELTGKLVAERAARKEETRRLRAQLDEGLSPEVAALREELERQRQRAQRAEADARTTLDRWRRVFDDLIGLLTDGLGLSVHEAFDIALWLDPEHRADWGGGQPPVLADENEARLRDGQAVYRVQVARGQRHRADVVKLLADKAGLR
jgi:hypothetical protein